MKKNNAAGLIDKVINVKATADDMRILAAELNKLPKGQLKKLAGNNIVTDTLGKYGVYFDD